MTDHFADRPAAQAPPREPAPLTRDGWSFAVLIFAAQMLVVLLVVAGLAIATYQQQNRVILDDRQSTVAAVTITLANDPFVSESLTGPDATALLQPYANKILAHAQSLDFITIMTPDGIRVTHPNPQEIGQKYIGSTTQALNGEIFNEQAVGTLGNSVRTIAPVYHDGTVVGLVSSGYTLQNLQLQYRSELPQILLVSALALLLAGFSAWFFSRYVNQATLGFGPHGLRRLYAFYFSALHSVREGLVLLDRRHRIVLYNQEAARLLDLPEEVPGEGLNPQQVQMPETLRALMTTGRSCKDEIHLGAHTVLSVSQGPARLTNANLPRMGGPWRGWFGIQPLTGQVLTLRDLTEVQELAGELQSLKTAKAAQAHERGIKLDISAQGFIPTDAFQATDIVTIVGNLLDNALDVSVGTEDATVWVEVTALGDELIIAVADSGPGIEPEFLENLLRFGVSTKSGVQPRGLGLALVQQAVLRLDGTMNVDNDAGAIFTVTLPFRPRT